MIENPYEVSESNPSGMHRGRTGLGGTRMGRAQGIVCGLVYIYPLLLVASFYGCWLVAYMTLGHPPRPSLDDPKSIGGVMNLVYIIPGVMLLGAPIMFFVGCAASLFCPLPVRASWRIARNLALTCVVVTLNLGAFCF